MTIARRSAARIVSKDTERTAERLLAEAGRTYASRAGIRLADTPAPLYQLLVLSTLLSARISADVAVAAAHELFKAGFTTPVRMLDATWQQRVDALGRGHYRRYDERTSAMLGEGAHLLVERYDGDLRHLAEEGKHRTSIVKQLLQQFPGVGPVGADIFLREVQAVWTWVRPYADSRVVAAAKQFQLPKTAHGLATLAKTDDVSKLTAALIDASLHKNLRSRILETAD